jgi:hypothetical protein
MLTNNEHKCITAYAAASEGKNNPTPKDVDWPAFEESAASVTSKAWVEIKKITTWKWNDDQDYRENEPHRVFTKYHQFHEEIVKLTKSIFNNLERCEACGSWPIKVAKAELSKITEEISEAFPFNVTTEE